MLVVTVEFECEGQHRAAVEVRQRFFKLKRRGVIFAKLRINRPPRFLVAVNHERDCQMRALIEGGLGIHQLQFDGRALPVRWLGADMEVGQIEVAVAGAARAAFDERLVRQRLDANRGHASQVRLRNETIRVEIGIRPTGEIRTVRKFCQCRAAL